MDRLHLAGKAWYVDVTFRGETKTYTIKGFGVITEIQAKNIAFLMFVEDIKSKLAEEVQFEMTPATPDFTRS